MRAEASVLVVDNYDSFTFNLVQALAALGAAVSVRENDRVDVEAIRAMRPTHVVLSPGPGRPEDAGSSLAIARAAIDGTLGEARLLGVCLGHQCIGLAAGGRVIGAKRLVHGRGETITHDARGLFAGLPQPLVAGRYHSLAVAEEGLPEMLRVCARAEDGEVMAITHASGRVDGVQFHPESVLTPDGVHLLARFLEHGTHEGGVR